MSIETSIIRTLAFFDIFDFPLTREEVFNYLWQGGGRSAGETDAAIARLVAEGKILSAGSYYFFPLREGIIEKRNRSVAPTEKNLFRAKLASRLIRGIPFLRAIFVCNSVASETAKVSSDIDFFIVVGEGRLWFVRFFSNLILRVLGMRTGKNRSAGRVCLSFFAGENHLDLGGLRVSGDDVYLAYWLRQLNPLYDPRDLLHKIWRANGWLKDYLDLPGSAVGEEKGESQMKKITEKILQGKTGEMYERIFKKIQWAKLRPELKSLAEAGGKGVVISSGLLKFHEKDARAGIRERWLKNCQKYAA